MDDVLNPVAALECARGAFGSMIRPLSDFIGAVPALGQVGLLLPYRPDQVMSMLAALRRWGRTPATG